MINIDTSGLLEAVRQTVDQVADSVDEGTLRAVGYAGAAIFRDEAKRNALAHVETGLLHRSIIVKRLEEKSDGATKQVYLVTVREGSRGREGAFYWSWVERGHKFVPRNTRISKKTGKKIGWAAHRRAAELEYGTATVPAYPFMRPAYDSKKQEAVDMMSQALSEQIKRNSA